MANNLEIKKEVVDTLSQEIESKGDVNAFVVNYASLTSEDMNALKAEMYKSQSKITVVKNTLIKRILVKLGVKFETELEGQNALLIPGEDTIAPLKDLFGFIKKNDKGAVVLGVLNKNVIDSAQVEALSKLPTKVVLIAQVLGGFTSPIRGFVYTLNGVQGNFVRTLNAIKEKKSVA